MLKNAKCAVTQASLLGPLLFLVYINNWKTCVNALFHRWNKYIEAWTRVTLNTELTSAVKTSIRDTHAHRKSESESERARERRARASARYIYAPLKWRWMPPPLKICYQFWRSVYIWRSVYTTKYTGECLHPPQLEVNASQMLVNAPPVTKNTNSPLKEKN